MRGAAGASAEEAIMKYMIMMYGTQQDYDAMSGKPGASQEWTPEKLEEMHTYMHTYHQKLVESGELVATHGLTAPVHARRVHLANRVPVVTDGPYAETQEVLVGYTIVECSTVDRAIEIAAGLVNPDAPGEYVDIRPVMEGIEDLD
jgi:hypothetical protein